MSEYKDEGSMLVCYVGTHLLDYRVSQNPENASGEKKREKNL
jgi:hypothetical protein